MIVVVVGASIYRRVLPILGLAGDPDFPEGFVVAWRGTPAAEKVEDGLAAYCASRTSEEVESELNRLGVPASRIFTPEDMLRDPHYQARKTITEWFDDNSGKMIKGYNIVPKLKNNPGMIWRGAPQYGEHNEEILEELGFTLGETEGFYERGVIRKRDVRV